MKLNEKYELTEKVGDKNLYKAIDHFNNIEIFIEPYREIESSDWTAGGKINEELRKLKIAQKIDDYFYTDNKQKKTKIFYKIYLNNPLDIKKNTESKSSHRVRSGRHSRKTLTHETFEDENTAISNNTDADTSRKVFSPVNAERVMVCENCKTEINLRNFHNSTNTAYCEVCHKEHGIIFKEKENKKQRAKASRYVKIKKTKNKLLIEVSKGKIEMVFLMGITILWAMFRLSEAEFLFQTLEVYLYIGIVVILFLMILDKNYIEVTKGVLKTYSKPISITASKKFKVKDIEQLYVKKGITEGAGIKTYSRFVNGRKYEKEYYADAELDIYYLIVILKDGKGEFSILETHNSSDALLLEKTIEKFLKIKDVNVAKEIV